MQNYMKIFDLILTDYLTLHGIVQCYFDKPQNVLWFCNNWDLFLKKKETFDRIFEANRVNIEL